MYGVESVNIFSHSAMPVMSHRQSANDKSGSLHFLQVA